MLLGARAKRLFPHLKSGGNGNSVCFVFLLLAVAGGGVWRIRLAGREGVLGLSDGHSAVRSALNPLAKASGYLKRALFLSVITGAILVGGKVAAVRWANPLHHGVKTGDKLFSTIVIDDELTLICEKSNDLDEAICAERLKPIAPFAPSGEQGMRNQIKYACRVGGRQEVQRINQIGK